VREAAQQVGYRDDRWSASRHARRDDGLAGRTGNVGIVLEACERFADPFWAPVLEGATEELLRLGYGVRFNFLDVDLEDERNKRQISPDNVDGLIVLGGMESPSIVGDVGWPVPMVVAIGPDCRPDWEADLRHDVITMEKRVAMGQLVDHLLALGRRRLVFFGPSPEYDRRAEGFVLAMTRRNVPVGQDSLIACGFSAEEGQNAMSALLRRLDEFGEAPDGVVCASDLVAIGALRALKEYGVRVPDDMAVTGFDDIAFAADTHPPLTTLHVPKALFGGLAARQLLERIERPDQPPIILTVPSRLVVRESCGARLSAQPAGQAADGRHA
jgi:DNA-binding LacI/PurR family transcriptional regulator